MPKVDEWQTVGDRRFRWSGWLSAVVLVAVMLVCSAVYAWLQRPKASVTAQANPQLRPVPQQAAPQNVPPPARRRTWLQHAGGVPPAQPVRTSRRTRRGAAADRACRRPCRRRQPAGTEAGGARSRRPPPRQITPPNADATVHVEITADEAVWVLARADGKYAFSGTLDAAHHAHAWKARRK